MLVVGSDYSGYSVLAYSSTMLLANRNWSFYEIQYHTICMQRMLKRRAVGDGTGTDFATSLENNCGNEG